MIHKLIPIILFFLLSACSPFDIEKFADDAVKTKADYYFQNLRAGEFEEIQNLFEPSLRPQLTDELLRQMSELLGEEAPKEIRLIGYNASTFNKEPTRYNLSYQFGYENKWILANIAFRTLNDGIDEIFALNVYHPMDRSLQEVNRFTLEGKSATHYLFLAGCTLIPIFTLFTLIVAIRTKFEKRKWLWILFILIGIVQFSINWTTGQSNYKLASIHLLGTSAVTASIYSPWIISFSLPIGALLFWIKRDKLKVKKPAQVIDTELPIATVDGE